MISLSKGALIPFLCENRHQTLRSRVNALKIPTFHIGDKAQTPFKVGADRMEAPPELRVTAILVGATSIIADVQLVAALGHCWDAQVHLQKREGRKRHV